VWLSIVSHIDLDTEVIKVVSHETANRFSKSTPSTYAGQPTGAVSPSVGEIEVIHQKKGAPFHLAASENGAASSAR
jgi:hypothetical protein